MANTFNTRIQLKRDTLTNWNGSNIVLKPGEIGVAYVDVATQDAKGNIIHVPTALLKVGENVEGSTKTFKELPFVSALAADVYAWAKKEGIEVIDEGNGEVLSDVAWDAAKNALVLSRIDVVTPAELTEALKDYYTKTEIDAKIKAINDSITDLDVSALEGRVADVEETLEGHGDIVTHNVAEFATNAQGTKADNAAAAIATYGDIVTHNAADFDEAGAANTVNQALEAYKTSNDQALADVKTTAEAARTETEVNSQIDAKITALNLGTTYEPIGAETRAKGYVDQKFTDANLAQYTTEQEVKDIVDGVIAGAADDETYNSLTKLVDYIDAHGGEAAEMAQAIETLEGQVSTLESKPAYNITTTQITNWDGEVGAKAAAAAAQKTADDYATAHASDYTNAQIDDAIDADVKTAIDAEVLRANGAYDAKGAAADAQAAAIADAAGKYETKGTAQGIINALNLAETYEPIGAETRAIAAAKTETTNQINALNIAQYAKAADLHTVATSGNIADLEQTANTYILFDCGTSTLVL